MISSFFTLSGRVQEGIAVSWKRRGFIAVGDGVAGIKVPVASEGKIVRVHHGTVQSNPKLRIEPLPQLPAKAESHAVLLIKGLEFPAEHCWESFPFPKELRAPGRKASSATGPRMIGSGSEVIDDRERSSLLVALPPESAIELPYFETGNKVLLWLGTGAPTLVSRTCISGLRRRSS